jgi:alanyl-tRNA synthetase
MKTTRLHYDDPLHLEFDAEVVGHSEHAGRFSLLLDRTAFYAEAGGQSADRGMLAGAPLLDVQLDGAGRVHHVLDLEALRAAEGEAPPIGALVHGAIDARRRRENMALHTGQHALSRALLDQLGAVTVSSRLGESACTIDVDRGGLEPSDLARVEDAVNALVDEDRPVRQFFPGEAELATMALRKPPPETDRVRVVVIEGFDVTPCGGTHCTSTSQIELVRVEGVERYKGGTRITFSAGPRARRALIAHSEALRGLAAALKCAPAEVAENVAGLRRKLDEARVESGGWRASLATLWAERLERPGEIVAVIEGADAALLEAIGARLATGGRLVALAAPRPEGTDVVLMRGPESGVHCGQRLDRLAKRHGGRGGGRAEHARGRLPSGVDWVEAVANGD